MVGAAILLSALGSLQTTPAPQGWTVPDRSGWAPFVIPSLGEPGLEKSEIDLSFLSPAPAGANGRLRPRGEQLVDGRGRPVFLFGTNITDFHTVPARADAERIARRMKQLGFNYARLHYADWSKAPDGLMKPDMETVDPAMRDRLHYLVAQLKRNGIYVNINLHVARRYAAHPPGGNWLGKVVDRILPELIASQKSFARQLLSPKNPHTGFSLADDPAVAMVEINNENSLLQANGYGWSTLHTLPEPQLGRLTKEWNAWLAKRYPTAARLGEAWKAVKPLGDELLPNARFLKGAEGWELEASGGAEATLKLVNEAHAPVLRWIAAKPGAQDWSHQVHATSLSVRHGRSYRLEVVVRGTPGLRLGLRIMQQQAPWSDAAPAQEIELTQNWQEVAAGFAIVNPGNPPVRLSFSTSNKTGEVDFRLVSLREGDLDGLQPGQDPAKGTVPYPGAGSSAAAMADLYQFMVDKELAQTKELKDFLKNDLKVKAPITDTQVNYGGMAGLLRARRFDDVVDIHGYPMHPNNITGPEGSSWWATGHGSMAGSAMPGLAELAMWRVKGRPFTVTEFDLNPPNHFAAETIPLITVLALYQGWAGFAEYAWLNFQPGDLNPDRIRFNFGTTGHAGQMATIPPMALMARLGLIKPASRVFELAVTDSELRKAPTGWGSIPALWGENRLELPWRGRLAVTPAGGSPLPASSGPVVTSDTGEISWNRSDPARPFLVLNAARAKMAAGVISGRSLNLGGVALRAETSSPTGGITFAAAPMDGRPFSTSRRVIACLVGRVENKGMAWSPDGNAAWFGGGPTLIEHIRGTISLPGRGWRAHALDGRGRKTRRLAGSPFRLDGAGSAWILFER